MNYKPKFSYKYLEDKWSTEYWKFIRRNIDKPLDWYYLSQNSNINWDIIKKNIDIPWQWISVSLNPNINKKIVKDNPNFPWRPYYLSKNQNITGIRLTFNNINLNNLSLKSSDKNLNWEIIENKSNYKWDWTEISKNNMEIGKKNWINKYRLKIIKTLTIQRIWRLCISNPEYKLCKKQLKYIYSK